MTKRRIGKDLAIMVNYDSYLHIYSQVFNFLHVNVLLVGIWSLQ